MFEFFNLAKDYSDRKKYGEAVQRLKEDGRIMYIEVNINGECETAQNKYPVIRVMPGVLIPCEVYSEYENSGVLKAIKNAGDYICLLYTSRCV